MDAVEAGVEGLWDMPLDAGALVQDVPDPASVAILAMTLARELDSDGWLRFQQRVRARYRALTRPGTPDGPAGQR